MNLEFSEIDYARRMYACIGCKSQFVRYDIVIVIDIMITLCTNYMRYAHIRGPAADTIASKA